MTWEYVPVMGEDDRRAYDEALGAARKLIAEVQDIWERVDDATRKDPRETERLVFAARWRTDLVKGDLVGTLERLRTPTPREARVLGTKGVAASG